MLVDYYVLKGSRELLDTSRLRGELPEKAIDIGWSALIASLAGALVGLYGDWGIPAFNSLVAASLFYWLVKVAVRRREVAVLAKSNNI